MRTDMVITRKTKVKVTFTIIGCLHSLSEIVETYYSDVKSLTDILNNRLEGLGVKVDNKTPTVNKILLIEHL